MISKNQKFFPVLGIVLIALLLTGVNSIHAESPLKKISSPLKQIKSGIKAEMIQCNQGLQLVIKSNNSPACLKPTSITRLVELGWVKTVVKEVDNDTDTQTKTITLDDNNSSITLHKGERFVLSLGENFEWEVTIDDQSVLSRVVNITPLRDSQGVYETYERGQTDLTAVGNPWCLKSVPACKMASILFKIHVTVVDTGTNQQIGVFTEKDRYSPGEPIEISITNLGNTRLFPVGWGYSILDYQDNRIAPNGVLNMMLVALPPGESTHWTWEQTDINGTQVSLGKYKIVGLYTEEGTEQQITSVKEFEIQK